MLFSSSIRRSTLLWCAAAALLAGAPAQATEHFCAIAFAVKRPTFPEVFLLRTSGAESPRHAACRAVNTWADGGVSEAPDCKLGAFEKAARCVAVTPDPVVDAIGRGGAGVAGATAPKRRYRCQLPYLPLSAREQPWEIVEVSSWADVEAAARQRGARNDPKRGQCLPVEVYDSLVTGLGR